MLRDEDLSEVVDGVACYGDERPGTWLNAWLECDDCGHKTITAFHAGAGPLQCPDCLQFNTTRALA